MSLTFLLGGARSGKSSLAVELARGRRAPVTVIATAEARDDEMRARIEQHRAKRPADWATVEEPLSLDGALAKAPADGVVIVDCLSLWVANLIERGDADSQIQEQSRAALSRVAERRVATIAVSNEVGLGVVPVTELGRRYRDLLGRVNADWAAAAEEALFVVAGRTLPLR
jgi:adenosylcobinamide kinase / adenosylcobinamide-phosphate guanylyltransferase